MSERDATSGNRPPTTGELPEALGWEPRWEESEESTRVRRHRWLPSTRMFVMALAFWVGGMLLLALGLFSGNVGSNQTVLAIFLICLIVAAIAGAFSSFLVVFGLVRYRRRKILNLILLIVSLVTNPVVLVMAAAAGIA